MLEFRILGPLEVVEDSRIVPLEGLRQRGLLVLLLIEANRTVSSDRLIDQLWGERPPANAANALQAAVGRLRRVLPDGGRGGPIATRPSGYAIEIEPESLDWHRFTTLAELGGRELLAGEYRSASNVLSAALALWRGPALSDLACEPYAAIPVAILTEARTAAFERWAEAELALGYHAELVGPLREIVGEQPYNEALRRQLMLALYRSGRQADALEAYREARNTLVSDLGIEPGPELQQMQRAVLEQDPTLGPIRREPLHPGRRRLFRRSLFVVGAAAAAAGIALLATAAGGRSSTTTAPDSVAVIDLQHGRLDADVRLSVQPDAAVAALGSVWVVDRSNRLLVQIDPAKRRVTKTTGLGLTPDSMSAGPDGLWLMDSQQRRLATITPDVTGVNNVASLGGATMGSVADGAGAVWVALQEFPAVDRVDPSSGRLVKQILLPVEGIPGHGGYSTVVVAGGSVWVGNFGGDISRLVGDTYGFLAAVDPATNRVRQVVRLGESPRALAFAGGLLWAVLEGKDELTAIDPTTGAVVASVPVGAQPDSIATGAGAVWVADGGDDTVMRIDPIAHRVIQTIKLEHRPVALALGHGTLWVAIGAG